MVSVPVRAAQHRCAQGVCQGLVVVRWSAYRVSLDSRPDHASSSAQPSAATSAVLVAVLCLIWGSTWLVIKEGLVDLPAFFSAGVRFAVAALLMSVIAAFAARREGGTRPTLGLSLAMGICNFGLSYGLVYWAERVLPSGLVSVLWAIFPLQMAICGHLALPGERLRGKQWFGLVLGFAGIGLLFLTDLRELGPEAVPAGLLLLLSPTVSSLGTTIVKRYGTGTNSLQLNRNGMWIGTLVLLGAALVFERDATIRFTPRAALSVLYLAVIGTVLTFGLYFWLMRFAPAYLLSLIAYITPVIALALGASVGGEPLMLHTIMGAAIVFVGVAFVVPRKRRAPTRNAEP